MTNSDATLAGEESPEPWDTVRAETVQQWQEEEEEGAPLSMPPPDGRRWRFAFLTPREVADTLMRIDQELANPPGQAPSSQ